MPAWLDAVLGDPPAKPPIPSWLAQHLAQPTDATAVARPERAAPQYGKALRQTAGGVVQGIAQVPEQLAAPLAAAAKVTLPPDIAAIAKPQHKPGPDIPAWLGDVIGGPQRDVSDSSFRQIGNVVGNMAGWAAVPNAMPELKTVDVSKLAPRKLTAALLEDGGATLHPSGQRFSGSAYMVADPAFTVEVKTPKDVQAFLARRDVKNALDSGKLFGKWTDPETGITEINLSDPVTDVKAAQKLAAQRGEQALGHIENGQYLGDVRNPHAPVGDVKRMVSGMQLSPLMKRITEIPETRGQQLAQAYEALPKNDPAAKASYDALNAEVAKQKKAFEDAGYKIEFTGEDPYKNSSEMMADVRDNKTLKVFKTPGDNFHPYMTPQQNDDFRAVHDLVAHAGGGNQFGPVGEENAYRMHASTLSPEALPALAAETRGQNSWVNFGPNAHLPVKERPFAEQKAALFPQHLLGDYEDMGLFGAPSVRVNKDWQPTERGVFDRSPEGGVPSGEYREPAPLPFSPESRPRAGVSELAQQIATDPRVEARITSDVEKGLPLGGRPWYGLLPLRRYLENLQGALSFKDFNMGGAAGSARTSTHNELTNMSLLLYAKKHGIPYEEARQEFLRRFPGTMRPTFMGMHGLLFDRGQGLGFMGPASEVAGELKIPHYYHNRMLGAQGIPLDTHELKMIGQSIGLTGKQVKAGLPDAESYLLATQPYYRVGNLFGLHPDQVQASRWLGGGLETGLKSQPKGDFLQTLEDGLLFTARRRGMGESPKELRSLFDRIARGEDFFLPSSAEGGFPVY